MSERCVWITGGGTGMGAASAQAAAAAGWTVVVSGRRQAPLEAVVDRIQAAGGTARALPLDVREPGAIRQARDRILADHGRLDALVLAAGLNAPNRRWNDQTMASFQSIIDTNLTAVVETIDAALPALRERAGVAVIISSYAGWSFQPNAGVAYSASKTALASIARSLNQQEAASGLRATHLCPGDVATDFLDQRPQVPDAAARAVMLTPDDIARAVMFVLDARPEVRIDELVISPVSQH